MTAMREPTYFILAALLDGPAHGYGIVQQARELSDGRVRLTAGTLYGALDRLEADGHISFDGEEAGDGPTRRCYRLTKAGRALLDAEMRRMEANLGAARSKLKPA